MSRAVKYMEGSVRVRVASRYPERFINICASGGVDFRDLRRNDDGTNDMTVTISGYRRLKELEKNSGVFSVKTLKKSGAPFLLWNLRRRYTLILGLFLSFGIAWCSSFFIWQIDISGNRSVSDAEIMEALGEVGVKLGTCTFAVSRERVSNELLLRLKKLAWITVNIHGSRASVICREKIPIPEIVDYSEPKSIYASKPGIIESVTVLRGTADVMAGQTVTAGERLVAGGEKTRADAQIFARTWYELCEKMPLSCLQKEYTGQRTVRTAIIVCGKRINLYFNGGNPYTEYDKITTYNYVTLPGDSMLPIAVVREEWDEVRYAEETADAGEAGSILSARLLERLEDIIGSGRAERLDFTAEEEDGALTVTLAAECVEQIGAVGDYTPE